jgi:NADPH:quinone reductase-like Zn-dependent oxidoreductase
MIVPIPKNDEVLIRVKAFGLNRSELFTRQGHSPNVRFPRVLGIEAVGLVEEASSMTSWRRIAAWNRTRPRARSSC